MRLVQVLLLCLLSFACGRNTEREIAPVSMPDALNTVGEGTFASAAGGTATLQKIEEGWSLGLEITETKVFTMTVAIDASIQRANIKLEFPYSERNARVVEPVNLRSYVTPDKIGIFGKAGKTDFEVHCRYGGTGGVSGVVFIPSVPKGTKAKYDYRMDALKRAVPDVNYVILTNGLFYETRAMAAGVPVAADLEALVDGQLKSELGSVLKASCGNYAPSMNYVGYMYGIALERMSAQELRIVSTHARTWDSPVFNKTERERSFRRVR